MTTDQQYKLGPQDDGSTIIRIPDEWHRVILQKALEKQGKNAQAAEGTIGALADGADPFLSKVQTTLTTLAKLVIGARSPASQLDGTPLGAALAGTTGVPTGKSTGKKAKGLTGALPAASSSSDPSDGIVWDASVPAPRPAIGQLVRWPTGQTESLSSLGGYDAKAGAFAAESEETVFSAIVPSRATQGEWWLLSLLLDYPEQDGAALAALANAAAQDVGDGTEQSGADLVTDYGTGVSQAANDDEEQAALDAWASEGKRVPRDREARETPSGYLARKAGRATVPATSNGDKPSQRERNALRAGARKPTATKSATRPAPKPSAKKGSKKGGK